MLENLVLLFQDTAEETNFLTLITGPADDRQWLTMIIVAVLLVMATIAVYIFIERYSAIKRASKVDENFMTTIRANVSSGNLQAARTLCQTTDSPVARMVEKGLMRIGKPMNDINSAIENVGQLELFRMEKNISTLASISGAAPMIGFFGTVTGMIAAFREMTVADNITPTVLAGGIYQALLTTAFGLFVGIIAYIGYNLLVTKIDKVLYKMERSSIEFIDLLQEPAA